MLAAALYDDVNPRPDASDRHVARPLTETKGGTYLQKPTKRLILVLSAGVLDKFVFV